MRKAVIIGAGHAAGQAVATLRLKQYPGSVTLLGDEPHLPYQRPPLSKKFLSGDLPLERLYLKPADFYAQPDIEVRLDCHVDRLDPDQRQVFDSDGNAYAYDDLIIATGARVRTLDLPGAGLAGIHYLRSIADVDAMRERFVAGSRLVVVGAGYIGLEVAAVATTMGLDVTVVEMAERVMSRVTCADVSDFYQHEHQRRGVQLRLACRLQGFAGNERVNTVRVDNDDVDADLVLIGVGVEPNVELAAAAGLLTDNGIVVDEYCRTKRAEIYAIGDCSNHPSTIYDTRLRLESVHNALEQAKTAASNICGDSVAYNQVPWFWSDQFDLKLQIAGISSGHDQVIVRGKPAERSFSCLYLRDGVLIAVDSINAPRDFMASKALIAGGAQIDPAALADTSVLLKDMG